MELKHFNECIEWWNNRTEIIDEDENPKAKKYVYKDFEERDFDLVFSSAPKGEHVRLKTDRLSAPVRRTYPQES